MQLHTKARTALNAMIVIALQDGRVTNLKVVAEQLEVSLSYLESLFGPLGKHGLVVANRGPGGGYRISHPLNEICVADVVLAVDDDFSEKWAARGTMQGGRCLSSGLWQAVNRELMDYLDKVTLAEVVATAREAAKDVQ